MTLNYTKMIAAGIDEQAIKEFIQHRKNLKKPLTQEALERNMREAWKCKDLGITPEMAIYETIDNGWQGIKVRWLQDRLADIHAKQVDSLSAQNCGGVSINKKTREMTTAEMMDRNWAT